MGLPVDIPGTTTGPGWATDNESARLLLDAHTHVSGQGVQVPSAGINVNANLPFGGFRATNVGGVGLAAQSTTSSGTLANTFQQVAGNLYWNNASSVPVQLTAGNVAIVSASGVSGLVGTTAAWTYSAGLFTFTGTADVNKSAALDGGAVTIRETNVLNAKGITLKSPTSLASNYNITLPPTVPAASGLMLMDTSGAAAVSQVMMPPLTQMPTALASVPTPPATIAGGATLYLDSTTSKWMSKTSSTSSYPLYMAVNNKAQIAGFNTTETVISGGAASASVASDFKFPANSLKLGSVIRFTIWGDTTSTVANVSTFKIRAGSAGTTADATVFSSMLAVTAANSGTNVPWKIVIELPVTTIGASASVVLGHAILINQGVTGISATQIVSAIGGGNSTFDSTAAIFFSATLVSAASTTSSRINVATAELI